MIQLSLNRLLMLTETYILLGSQYRRSEQSVLQFNNYLFLLLFIIYILLSFEEMLVLSFL